MNPQPPHHDDTIEITINGEPRRIAANRSVADVLATLEDEAAPASAVATAVNGDFVARTARSQRTLQHGDALFVFQPVTGG